MLVFLGYLWEASYGSWLVAVQMAPYLLFGFLIAGVLSVVISPDWVERHLGGRGIGPIVKGVLFGIPLPLCSCGVIPVTASIRNHGASRGATVGFLLATPQTGVDSILATFGLLGPVFGVFRPLAALVTGVVGGGLTQLFDADRHEDETATRPTCTAECCTGDPGQSKVVRALRYGFVTLPADIGKALTLGIVVAGLIAVFVPEDALVRYLGGGFGAMVAMMAVGIPIYVCSTASIPIAIGFMHMGASPGAALAFLISGPATNAATLAMAWKVLGKRTAVIYLATVALGALAAGLCLDLVIDGLPAAAVSHLSHVHEKGLVWYHHAAGVGLAAVVMVSLVLNRLKGHVGHATPDKAETVTLRVTGMSCSRCGEAVARSLREMAGVDGVEVHVGMGRATVTGMHLDAPVLCEAVRSLGYGVVLEQ